MILAYIASVLHQKTEGHLAAKHFSTSASLIILSRISTDSFAGFRW